MFFDSVQPTLRASGLDPVSIAKGSTFIRIQNVVDYYESTEPKGYTTDDFPRVMSPWPSAWLEWRCPISHQSRGAYLTTHAGSAFRMTYASLLVSLHTENWRVAEPQHSPQGKYMLSALCIGEEFPTTLRIYAYTSLLEDGTFARDFLQANGDPTPWAFQIFAGTNLRDAVRQSEEQVARFVTDAFLNPLMLALSFCHCRNVALDPQDVPAALQRRREHRGHPPVSRWYTLNIQPMQKILRTEGHRTNVRQALHVCRGHFKDYREGAGLFGRQKGLFWWEMHARGDPRRGEVRKDYAVCPNPPVHGSAPSAPTAMTPASGGR